MIIVKLMGGLGNQLFQYAAGRRLAHKHNTLLKLDLAAFPLDPFRRTYALHSFNIINNIATREDTEPFNPGSRFKRLISLATGRPMIGRVFYARDFVFEAEILDAPDDLYMIGYWQSEEYFRDIECIIRNELTVTTPQTGYDALLADRIASCESVSLHVRRGDYVANKSVAALYRQCGGDYYRACVDFLTKRIVSPVFFVFSDDISWAEANLDLGYPTVFVGDNAVSRSREDLRLMSMCRHNIIANSSFSWWGAWLNSNPGKMVLAPGKWLVEPKNEPENIIPDNWIKM